jgi:hypothetical protein
MHTQCGNMNGATVFIVSRMNNKLVIGADKQMQSCDIITIKQFKDIFYSIIQMTITYNKTIATLFQIIAVWF